MFYSKEILARKDTNIGLIWLAATTGPRSGVNKLSRKMLNNVNIVRSCHDITQPPEPLALRLSSNLMLGLVRVYGQQYIHFVADVTNTWDRIKRDLALAQIDDLCMANPIARLDAITFDYDIEIEHELERPLVSAFTLGLLNEDDRNMAIDLGWRMNSQISSDGSLSDNDANNQALMVFGKDDERRRRITLDEDNRMTATDMRPDFGFGNEELVTDNSGLYFDEDGNLVDYMPENFGAVNDADLVPESNDVQPNKRKGDGQPELEPHPKRTIVPEYTMDIDDVEPMEDIRVPEIPIQPIPTMVQRPQQHRKPKAKGLAIDDPTNLPREALLLESGTQGLSRSDSELKRIAAATRAKINDLLTRPVFANAADYSTELRSFWDAAGARPADSNGTAAGPIDQVPDWELPRHFDYDQISLGGDISEPEIGRRRQGSDQGSTPLGGALGFDASDMYGPMPWSGAFNQPTSGGVITQSVTLSIICMILSRFLGKQLVAADVVEAHLLLVGLATSCLMATGSLGIGLALVVRIGHALAHFQQLGWQVLLLEKMDRDLTMKALVVNLVAKGGPNFKTRQRSSMKRQSF
ncbi:hypothetical protein BGZ94_009150 [Podila epigama]|nr:hypothetical protein BGZ94_009150 [Podila epigama]